MKKIIYPEKKDWGDRREYEMAQARLKRALVRTSIKN